jgi:5-methylcytosine-specific restriction endonuclease McrA
LPYADKKLKYRAEAQRRKRRREVAIAMLGGKCVQCGATERLEFDHIDPSTKTATIGQLVSRSTFWVEIEKCQLLCYDCHKKKTGAEAKKKAHALRKHGTWGMYDRGGCRCDKCKAVYNEYRKEWRKRRKSNA